MIGFGIVGCGLISKFHAAALAGVPGVRLAGVWDIRADAAQAFAAQHGATAFDTFEQMIASADIDAVCICTPSGFHGRQTIQALAQGKHVLVEKPMALTLDEADRAIALAEQNGLKLSVVSQLRFSPGIREARDILQSGALGKLVVGDVLMKYHRTPEYYQNGGWRGTKAHDGGGALMNQGIHGVDLLLHLMGPVRSAYAVSRTLVHDIEVEDTVSAVLEYQSGAIGLVQATTSVKPGYPRRFELCGDRGCLMIEEDRIIARDFPGAEAQQAHRKAFNADPGSIDSEGHRLQIDDFARAIREDRTPAIDGREGRRALALILGIYESSERGSPIVFEEEQNA